MPALVVLLIFSLFFALSNSFNPGNIYVYGSCGQFVASPAVVGQPWVLTFPPNPNQYLSAIYVTVANSQNQPIVEFQTGLTELNYYQYIFTETQLYGVSITLYRKTNNYAYCSTSDIFAVVPNYPIQVLTAPLPVYQYAETVNGYFAVYESYSSVALNEFKCGASTVYSPVIHSSHQSGVYRYFLYCNQDYSSQFTGVVVGGVTEIAAGTYYISPVNFGPINLNYQYYLSTYNKGYISFNTVYTRSVYVSYNFTNQLTACTIKSTSPTEQLVKCPPPPTISQSNFVMGRFVFISSNGLQQEGWSIFILLPF